MRHRLRRIARNSYAEILTRLAESPLHKIDKVFALLWALGHESPQRTLRAKKLSLVDGTIHIGASTGQEIEAYCLARSKVFWIEAIPEVHRKLEQNIRNYDNMESTQALVWSKSGETRSFNLASNDMHSSSVFELESGNGFGDVEMLDSIRLTTKSLDDIISQRREFWSEARLHLVIDVQGAELEVLRGATMTLPRVDSLEVEVSTYPVYIGGAQLDEIDSFLEAQGFSRITKCGDHYHGDAIYVRKKHVR